jgi:signal transduction histidine kinase/CheY-like chemotaxis protein
MGSKSTDLFALRADGDEFAASIRLAPFQAGGKSFVAAAIRDITEQRQINTALQMAQEEAMRANRAKSRFLAPASHDLRQPLQAIRLINASLIRLAKKEHSDSMMESCEVLLVSQEKAIESMVRLLNSLLEISRLESGAIQLKPEPVTIAAIFNELKNEFDAIALARNIDLQIGSAELTINTDRTLFHQLLQNLVGNAIKYTDQGQVAITCDAKMPDSLMITVNDTGIGIPEEKLDRIFDEYYQIDEHSANRIGVGLGLAIVKEAARLLGFTIEISSRLGDGTQVRIGIPKRFIVAEKVADMPELVRNTMGKAKPRVFLIEDNDSVRVATELFLKLEGYQITSAASVAETELLIPQITSEDVIITDYHLNGKITGLEVLRRLRDQLSFNVPAIIMSGDLSTVMRALKETVPNCKFLSKPVDTDVLLAAIDELSPKPQASSPKSLVSLTELFGQIKY